MTNFRKIGPQVADRWQLVRAVLDTSEATLDRLRRSGDLQTCMADLAQIVAEAGEILETLEEGE